MSAIEALEQIKPSVQATLGRSNLPKGYAKKLALKYVDFMIDVKKNIKSESRGNRVPKEDLETRYKEIKQILREVN